MMLELPPDPDRGRNLGELGPVLGRRIAALDEPVERSDWDDVVRRRAHRRPVGIAAIGLIALVVSLAAFGPSLLASSRPHGSSTTAAGHVFRDFKLGAPPIAARAIAAETRVITSTNLHGTTRTLYVSPASGGGFCFQWTGSSGSCEKLGTSLFSLAWARPRLVIGTVASPVISAVKIRFTDGTKAEPRVSWVPAPVNAGFFLYAIPRGKTVASIAMFDSTPA